MIVNTDPSMPETIEHVPSSTVSRPSSRTSATLELLAAREEHARLELQASAARLALLEAQAEADAVGSTISSTAPVNDNVHTPDPLPALNMPAPPRDGPGRPILPVNPPNLLPVFFGIGTPNRAPPEAPEHELHVDGHPNHVMRAPMNIPNDVMPRPGRELRNAQNQNAASSRGAATGPHAQDFGGGVGPLYTNMTMEPLNADQATNDRGLADLLFLDPIFKSVINSN